MSYYATSMSLVGVGPVFMLMTYIFIVNCRGIFEAFWIDSKRLKDWGFLIYNPNGCEVDYAPNVRGT
jgi:hypothetical protein